jgi:hypothetical protein
MQDHPAEPIPSAPPEVVRHDHGGWISGPSLDEAAEPVAAEHVRVGDVLLFGDGTRAEITDIRHGFYWLETGHEPGIALGWRAGSSTGLMFRRAAEVLYRVAGS